MSAREWREPVVLSGPFVPNRALIRRVVAEIEADARQRALRERHTWERVLASLTSPATGEGSE